jgi:hypothetical protein
MSGRHRWVSRRALLKGVLAGAAVSVGLPWLELFWDGKARAGGLFPKRFGLFFWGNGVHPARWVPQGEGAAWALSEQLAPLAGVKDVITVVSGMEVKVPNAIPHASGAAGILSGAALRVEGEDNGFAAASVDQVVAAAIGQDTRFRSIEYGAEPGSGLSYSSASSRNPVESSPYQLFDRVFGAGFRAPGEVAQVDPRLALRRSVLDAVREDAAALQAQVGAADRARLDQHMTSIRALELRLARLEQDPPALAACARPLAAPLADYPPVDGRAQVSAKNRIMCDLGALALACDQARVLSNFMTSPVNNILFPGATAGHHQLTHDEPGDQPQVHAIVLQVMEELAYMVEALRAVPEGEGTLLDSCALLATSDVSYGRTHSLDEFPIILAGGAGGALRQGLHYRSTTRESASKVHLTLLRALGVPAASFGEGASAAYDTLSAIEA